MTISSSSIGNVPGVLIDTSVWSLALRRKPHNLSHTESIVVEEINRLITTGQARIAGMIRQELLSGLRDQAEFERLRRYLRSFDEPRLDFTDYEEAALMFNRCRSVGITPSAVDILISAIAYRRGWRIFTLDEAFERYPSILGIGLHGAL